MTPTQVLPRAFLAALLLLLPCVSPAAEADRVLARFVAFGDSGYDPEFLSWDDGLFYETEAALHEAERRNWISSGSMPADFVLQPGHPLPDGGFAVASGLQPTARALHEFCRRGACSFAVMLGDNIYMNGATLGVDGIPDERRFRKLFIEPFADLAATPGFRIFAVLGNHDWFTSRAGAMAQVQFLGRQTPFHMDGFFYRAVPPAAPDVEIFAIDTYMLLAGTKVLRARLNDDGSEIRHGRRTRMMPWARPSTEAERGMAAWLEAALADSKARWKIVIGHHPIWSSGGTKFEEARVLRRLILPALCRHADLYFAGHEHSLEVLTDDCSAAGVEAGRPPLVQIVSGVAARPRPLDPAFMAYQARNYLEHETLFALGMVRGFSGIALFENSGEVRMLRVDGDGAPVREVFRHRFARRSEPGAGRIGQGSESLSGRGVTNSGAAVPGK
jgi:tartrate-resistant acid phosphatase type 5